MDDLAELRERLARLEAQFIASEKALIVTRTELERRLLVMNEFRAQIERERGMFVASGVYDVEHKALNDRLSELERTRAKILGYFAAYATLLGIGVIVLELLFKH